MVRLIAAAPILPARKLAASTHFYEEQLGFEERHRDEEYAIVGRDDVEIHLWGPSDIAPEDTYGMCRIEVESIDDLYDDCERQDIVHPNAKLERKPWGTREFAVKDLDNNLITFFER